MCNVDTPLSTLTCAVKNPFHCDRLHGVNSKTTSFQVVIFISIVSIQSEDNCKITTAPLVWLVIQETCLEITH